jgi:hypothetical protein
MKNINLRAVGVAALSTVAFSIGAVLPATAQFAPTPPRPPVAPTPPTSVRTDILIPTPPTRPTPPTAPTAPQVRVLVTNIRASLASGNSAQANAFIAQARALLAARGIIGR